MSELTEFGFEHTAADKLVVTTRDAKGLKYKMITEFDMQNLKDFLTKLESGNVEPPWSRRFCCEDSSQVRE